MLIYGSKCKEIAGAESQTTNNRMEMVAAIQALQQLTQPCSVFLHSDSAYLCNGFLQRWVEKWQRNGWRTATKKPVENQDLWQQLFQLSKVHNITWVKVKGHSDNELNNRCDELARTACAQASRCP